MKCNCLFLCVVFITCFGITPVYSQWIPTKGLTGEKILSIAVLDSTLFVGTDDNSVFVSTDNGENWTSENEGFKNSSVMALAFSGENLFAGSYGGVYISTDKGASWSAASKECNTPIFSLGVSDTNIFAGARDASVFLSTNKGVNWKELAWNSKVYNVREIAISGNNIFAGTWFYGAFRSTDNGANWLPVNKGLPANPNYPELYSAVNAIAFSGNYVFAGTYFSGVFRSTNNGDDWIEVNNGLTDSNVVSLTVSGKNLFAGTNSGKVFLSTNNGSNWSSVSAGLPNLSINEIAAVGNNLFAGTYGEGVWKRSLTDIITYAKEEKLEDSFCLYQNYPNPFNPTTTINYTIPVSINPSKGGTYVKLVVYDILGRELVTLVNEEKQPGNYKVKFNAGNPSSGIYFYKLSAGTTLLTKKMLLLK